MKVLKLDGEKYSTIVKAYPDEMTSITYCVPEILINNNIIKNNIEEHSLEMFQEYFDLVSELYKYKQKIDDCIFTSEVKYWKDVIEGAEYKKSRLEALINEDIEPYYWAIYKNFNSYVPELDTIIKDDYVLIFSSDNWTNYNKVEQ